MATHLLRLAALTGIGLAATASMARAQQAIGYAFAGPMAASFRLRSASWNAGGGGEWSLGDKMSIGGELSVLIFPSGERRTEWGGDSQPAVNAFLVSANVSRYFRGSNHSSWRPFVTGGISRMPGLGLFNAGGGVDRWIGPHTGIRLEVRDQFWASSYGAGSAMLGLRAALVFR
jgi:hypothetical protein